MSEAWDPKLYVDRHAFVYEHGQALLELAEAGPGTAALDVGCGTGQLTAALAARGTEVVGVDASPAMVEAARAAYPDLRFEVGDARALEAFGPVDLVFSNATLHWVHQPEEAVASMAAVLRPGGRLVAEFGGAGNVRVIREGVLRALRRHGHPAEAFPDPWFNPTVAQYAGLLAAAGLDVRAAWLFPRPTPLEGADGMRAWLEMFVRPHVRGLGEAQLDEVLATAQEELAPGLLGPDGWHADYVRLRVIAVRAG